jgi:predicted amidohydrolase YtcJ
MKLFHGARIYTGVGEDYDENPADAMLVSGDGRILKVGGREEVANYFDKRYGGQKLRKIDLGGKTVLPGFVDAHVHAPGNVLAQLFSIDLYEAIDEKTFARAIRDYMKKYPNKKTYYGAGFKMTILERLKKTPRIFLDGITGDKPLIIESMDGHTQWLNTAALAKHGIDKSTKSQEGGRIERDAGGEPTGVLSDCFDIVNDKPIFTKAQELAAVKEYQKKMFAWGFTAAQHMAPDFSDAMPIKKLHERGRWKLRVNFTGLYGNGCSLKDAFDRVSFFRKTFTDENLFKAKTVKFFMDGVIEGQTAALLEPYERKQNGKAVRGETLLKVNEFAELIKKTHKKNLQIHVHTIGDRATRDTLRAIKKSLEEERGKTKKSYAELEKKYRDTLTHMQLVSERDLDMMGRLNVVAAAQPFWHFKEPDWYFEAEILNIGNKRGEAAYPVKSFFDRNVTVSFSGDYPASPINNPFYAIAVSVTRNLPEGKEYGVPNIKNIDDEKYIRNKKERITVKQAISAYTMGGAYQLFREKEIGSLENGKFADFILLDRDPFRLPALKIAGTKVLATYINGEKIS